ncbi:MAG: hypothetical protein HYW23_01005 [Candidatus Aenigmarchaeota archaeon]|nr:hypothetical protein [Candidatus Aenigmarchaeota archaeon]
MATGNVVYHLNGTHNKGDISKRQLDYAAQVKQEKNIEDALRKRGYRDSEINETVALVLSTGLPVEKAVSRLPVKTSDQKLSGYRQNVNRDGIGTYEDPVESYESMLGPVTPPGINTIGNFVPVKGVYPLPVPFSRLSGRQRATVRELVEGIHRDDPVSPHQYEHQAGTLNKED